MDQELNGPAYPLYLSSSYFNDTQILRPDGYQRLMMQLTELKRKDEDFDAPTMIAQYNTSWVLLSLSVQIHRHILRGEKIHAYTWNTWQQGVLFRRDAVVFGEDNIPVFSAVLFHTLLDLHSRRISRDGTLYEALRMPDGKELIPAESRIPFQPGIGQVVGFRQVMPSWLDQMAHMNNIRYGEILYDCLDTSQQKRLCDLSRMELYFLHELRLGDAVQLYINDQKSSIEISAVHTKNQKASFGARLLF